MNGSATTLAALEAQFTATRKEWRYEMRREAQEILPGLFLGPFQPSWSLETLQSLGITHIFYLILEIRDADDQNLIRIFPQSQQFIDNCLAQGGKVLVHCGDGISRSPALVTGYVMVKTGLTHEDAFQFVQNRRFCVAPRIEFQHQLEAYRPIFQASQMVPSSSGNQANNRRRAREDSDGEGDPQERQRMPNWTPTDVVMSS